MTEERLIRREMSMKHSDGTGHGRASRFSGRVKTGVLCSLTVLAAPAANTCGAPDITGTWGTKVQTPGQLQLPFGTLNVTIQTTLRLVISKSGTDYVHKVQLCKLVTPTTPDPSALVVSYGPALLQTMVANTTAPAFNATVGGPVTIPPLTIQTGSNTPCTGGCVDANFVDSDNDGRPGVTLPVTVPTIGATVEAYAALTVPINLSAATWVDVNTINGAGAFSAEGQALRTNNILVGGGPIKVTTSTATTPVSLKRISAGDVPCSTVLQQLP
jgi:hypothetical protein